MAVARVEREPERVTSRMSPDPILFYKIQSIIQSPKISCARPPLPPFPPPLLSSDYCLTYLVPHERCYRACSQWRRPYVHRSSRPPCTWSPCLALVITQFEINISDIISLIGFLFLFELFENTKLYLILKILSYNIHHFILIHKNESVRVRVVESFFLFVCSFFFQKKKNKTKQESEQNENKTIKLIWICLTQFKSHLLLLFDIPQGPDHSINEIFIFDMTMERKQCSRDWKRILRKY